MTEAGELVRMSGYNHNCFVCKHSYYHFHDEIDIPIVAGLNCELGHEKTSYNTPFDESFVCENYHHTYFCKAYAHDWFMSFLIGTLVILTVIQLVMI